MKIPLVGAGLDTNALRLLRRDSYLTSEMVSQATSRTIRLILPSQALQEFWNNHRAFLKGADSLDKDFESLRTTVRRLTKESVSDPLIERLKAVELALAAFEEESADARDPVLFAKSVATIKEIESAAYVSSVPRARFGELGQIRFANKTPPGFEDKDKYPRHLGDFFVWADFLKGLRFLQVTGRLPIAGRVVFFTDDAKQDWITSRMPHPGLVAELHFLTGLNLQISSPSNIRSMLID